MNYEALFCKPVLRILAASPVEFRVQTPEGGLKLPAASRGCAIRLRECAVADSAEVQAAADFAKVALATTAELATARCRECARFWGLEPKQVRFEAAQPQIWRLMRFQLDKTLFLV